MVATDRETHTKSVPIPGTAALRRRISEPLGLGRPSFPPPPSGAAVYEARWSNRLTDCDGLGHVNNAVYSTLAEEVRGEARQAGGYGSTGAAAALRPVKEMSISYVGQARPFDPMVARTWQAGPQSFRVDFEARGELVAQVAFDVEAPPVAAGAARGGGGGGGGGVVAAL